MESKQNIPKSWYSDIILLAASETKINIETSQKIDATGLHFLFNNKKDAKDFENSIGSHIIKAIKMYIPNHNKKQKAYLMNLLFTTQRENIVVNIYW